MVKSTEPKPPGLFIDGRRLSDAELDALYRAENDVGLLASDLPWYLFGFRWFILWRLHDAGYLKKWTKEQGRQVYDITAQGLSTLAQARRRDLVPRKRR